MVRILLLDCEVPRERCGLFRLRVRSATLRRCARVATGGLRLRTDLPGSRVQCELQRFHVVRMNRENPGNETICSLIVSTLEVLTSIDVYRLKSVTVARINLSTRVFGLNAGFAHRVNTEARTNKDAWAASSFDASCNASAGDRYAHFPTQRLRIRD